ncbi:hypothetical protein EGI22_07550 [Lacihabitans sp. LS3-19]|uniref:hypothetical protein n=1 Tax=Lacihabitans sp. LS3-19 TaxID=2487335 RepID=UPI0020CC49CC|nr:hypothetical protein [Lacihabitans sp. LS3-19]MCP9767764.1 hypothetical protein [Lacihabitans sp. LS3-19]
MKKLFAFFALSSTVLFNSCTFYDNPAPITNEILAEVFEVKADFTKGNEFRNFYNLDPIIYNSDVLLVYELSGVDKKGADIWKPLPQIYTFNEGILQYNFDFTKADFSIFLDANFDPLVLNNSWRLNKTFRVVIVPGKFANIIDKNNLQNVMNTLKLSEESVIDLSI